jgi:hypothetical protein
MYLTRSSSILWQTLTKPLNYSLKEKNEQRFIYERLELLDQQYCLQVDQHLWQSYFDIGLQKHVWPVSIFFKIIPISTLFFLCIKDQLYTMAKTNDFELSKQYLMNYLQNIEKHLRHCQMELTKHSQSYPIRTLPFDQVELCLKQFVDGERKYLLTRNNEQLVHFKDDIHGKDLFKMISIHFSQLYPQVNSDIDFN